MTLRAVPTGFPPGRAGSLHAPGRVLEALRHEAVTELGGVLSGFWSGIEEQVRLAALAGHDYVAVQEDRVAVMALSHRALELATRFREAIEAEFERWEQAVEAPEQRERRSSHPGSTTATDGTPVSTNPSRRPDDAGRSHTGLDLSM